MAIFSHHREWVYPLKVKGRFSGYHKYSFAVLFAFLAIVPWLRLGGQPLVLADVPARRLYLLGTIFTASDGIFIMLLALTAAFSLFMFTTVFGRLWCGYACPQSVFMINLVFPIEAWIEGDRGKRMKLAKDPWTGGKVGRKLLKWAIYLALAVFISMSFMGFFVRTDVLWTLQAGATTYGIVAFFSFIWFWDFAWYREQVCNYICPYARFQGALTDDESLVISYDTHRGEPRGKAAKATGGCIDCKKCVVVCPQGIDIRDGFQLECIACGRCIDACTDVMDKLGHPTLVRYSTFAKDEGVAARGWARPRTMAYGFLLTALVGGIAYNAWHHTSVELLVDRAPGSLFVEDDDGYVRNTFLVSVTDRDSADGTRTYAVAVDGLPDGSQVQAKPIQLTTGARGVVPLVIRVPAGAAERTMPLTVHLRGVDTDVTWSTTFKGPGERVARQGEED
ncbi:MAG: cytochrome c oxidase accessory protein CcoG [Alphaproteobacteria bacterium]|nr:cytochrome c oxidase accessory protein CcoG [Alphaproteobacteria bacterium]